MMMFSPGGSILTLMEGKLKICSSVEERMGASYAGLAKVIREILRYQ